MALAFAGIDEAGYGPMLGPLCVGSAVFHVEHWSPGLCAPDLWETLESHVARARRGAGARFVVADSKAVKLANSVKTRHPLVHLERTVLAFLSCLGETPGTDVELFGVLGAEVGDEPWMGGKARALPVGNDAGLLAIDAAALRRAMSDAGVSLDSLRVSAMHPGAFNEVVRAHGTKAATTAALLREHMERLRDSERPEHTRLAIDRQGGRTHYGRLIERVFGDAEVLEESARASRYACAGGVGVLLTPKAEDSYFPVALASMAAKYVRELMMARLNAYFAAKDPELKPTAGYVQDARRWLRDAEALIAGVDRASLIRDA